MEKQISAGLKTTFLLHFIIGAILGMIYLLIPDTLGSLVNWPVKDQFVTRMLGAAVLCISASSWFAYKEAALQRVQIIVQMEILWTIIGTFVLLWGLLFAGIPGFGWAMAAMMAGFAIAFSIFYFKG